MNFRTKKSLGAILFFWIIFNAQCFSQQTQGFVRIESSAKINKMVAQKKQHNKSIETIRGFKIQLFYGNEKMAYEKNDEFKVIFPNVATKIIFSSPEWKVQVGNYITRLEADRSLVEIKKEFEGAIILETDIEFEN